MPDESSPSVLDPASGRTSLFDALIDARERFGGKTEILEDQDRRPLTYTALIRACFALGRRIKAVTRAREPVGVLLPTSMGVVVTFFALHAIGRIPVMLNFSAGTRNVRAACAAAGVKRVLTSRRFIAQGRLEDLIEDLAEFAQVTYLEDVRSQISVADRAYAALAGAMPRSFRAEAKPDDVGVILFTSGSFGAPRGWCSPMLTCCRTSPRSPPTSRWTATGAGSIPCPPSTASV